MTRAVGGSSNVSVVQRTVTPTGYVHGILTAIGQHAFYSHRVYIYVGRKGGVDICECGVMFLR